MLRLTVKECWKLQARVYWHPVGLTVANGRAFYTMLHGHWQHKILSCYVDADHSTALCCNKSKPEVSNEVAEHSAWVWHYWRQLTSADSLRGGLRGHWTAWVSAQQVYIISLRIQQFDTCPVLSVLFSWVRFCLFAHCVVFCLPHKLLTVVFKFK